VVENIFLTIYGQRPKEVRMLNMVQSKFGKNVILLMLAITFAFGIAPKFAVAGFSPTLDSQERADVDLDKIRNYLENKKVSETLASLGYSKAEINERLALLSQEEVSALAGQLDSAMTPNGSAVGVVIGIVIVVLVALGVLSLMGKKVTVSS
jgi:tetrahydromethanopterin S-methyltransferase subunit B